MASTQRSTSLSSSLPPSPQGLHSPLLARPAATKELAVPLTLLTHHQQPNKPHPSKGPLTAGSQRRHASQGPGRRTAYSFLAPDKFYRPRRARVHSSRALRRASGSPSPGNMSAVCAGDGAWKCEAGLFCLFRPVLSSGKLFACPIFCYVLACGKGDMMCLSAPAAGCGERERERERESAGKRHVRTAARYCLQRGDWCSI